jgi:hypothetical protein
VNGPAEPRRERNLRVQAAAVMVVVQELQARTCGELRQIASAVDLGYRSKMDKRQLAVHLAQKFVYRVRDRSGWAAVECMVWPAQLARIDAGAA